MSEWLTSLLKRLVTLKTSKKKTISCWQTMCQHLIHFHWSWEAQNSFCFRDCSSGRAHSAFARNKSKKLALFNYISYFQRYFTCLYSSHPIRWPDAQKRIFMVIWPKGHSCDQAFGKWFALNPVKERPIKVIHVGMKQISCDYVDCSYQITQHISDKEFDKKYNGERNVRE